MTNSQVQMTNEVQILNVKDKPVYDLEERTAILGERIIAFASLIPKTVITIPLISQIVRSGTSVGANYMEADAAFTKKDFQHKLSISRKEAKETIHWLRMIVQAMPNLRDEARVLAQECRELVKIFSSILR